MLILQKKILPWPFTYFISFSVKLHYEFVNYVSLATYKKEELYLTVNCIKNKKREKWKKQTLRKEHNNNNNTRG